MVTWFLDIDGVVNVLPTYEEPHRGTWPRWRSETVAGFPITYSPDLVDAIVDLSAHARIQWLTTWRERAVLDFAPALGLPRLEWTDGVGIAFPWAAEWWKCRAVAEHIQATAEPTIWTDDDMGDLPRDSVLAAARQAGTQTLLLRPSMQYGLTPDDVHLIRAFIGDHVNERAG